MIAPGTVIEEWQFDVEAGKLREFARAVKAPMEDGQAEVAPPTFTVVASADFVERLVTGILSLDRSRTVHGEQDYEYFAPIHAGDTLICRATLLSDEKKTGRRGGRMRVIKVCVEYFSKRTGTLVCRETMTSIETEAAAT